MSPDHEKRARDLGKRYCELNVAMHSNASAKFTDVQQRLDTQLEDWMVDFFELLGDFVYTMSR